MKKCTCRKNKTDDGTVRAAGIEIVPATGRALPAVPEEVLSLPGVHYGIFTNGAVVRDFGKNTWVSESCLSWEETIRVIEVLRRHPVIYDMYRRAASARCDCWHSWKNTGYRNVNAPISGRRAGQLPDMVEYLREKKMPGAEDEFKF